VLELEVQEATALDRRIPHAVGYPIGIDVPGNGNLLRPGKELAGPELNPRPHLLVRG